MDAGEDHISEVPDELLNTILVRFRSTRAAARTSALSRRCRHLWTPLPGLFLSEGSQDAAFLDTVDAALAACDAAPAIKGLTIALSIYCRGGSVPAERVAPWLRFTSQARSAWRSMAHGQEAAAVLDVPACEGVTRLELSLSGAWRVRPLAAGLFWAVTDLTIVSNCMDGSELTALVCKQCPRLTHLKLCFMLANASDISIRSDSLQSLSFSVCKARLLEIVAPRLEELSVSLAPDEARISAPKLAEVVWADDNYDPRHATGLMMLQFDEVDELKLGIYIPQGIADGYESFLNETNELPKCKILSISLPWRHGLVPGMLHLLRGCNSTRKVSLLVCSDHVSRYPCLPSCPCRSAESHKIDDIILNSLEEVEITSYANSHEVLEFVEQLSRCSATILKKVVMKYRLNSPPPLTKEVREKIRNLFQPKIEVNFYVLSDWKWVRLD
ncbi:unnamed protein product [Urochloa decumbens]|uniref:F-box/LRR-repeat protein 15/At3g58940/PEG3-like LRR domain-containing protein n=1 Tax=Urochloa decumbens TaxID=240449 RepID=A0ABC9AY58_9POAL